MMNARIDRSLIRTGGNSRRYVLVEVTAPESPAREGRVPVNVALVIDRSGSMGGQKIRLARDAATQAIRMLRQEDRFSVVVYDDVVDVLVASTQATAEAREEAIRRISGVEARNATDLSTGWLTGCEQVAAHLREEAVGKVLLLSDGLANRGITDLEALARHARELRSRGVLTSTFGVGADFDERLMQAIATEGAGHFYFIERPEQIPDLLTSELGETLEVVARDVELFIGVPEGARAELLHDYPTALEARGLRCRLGNLVSGQQVAALVAVTFPPGEEGAAVAVDVTLTDRDDVFRSPTLGFAPRYAGPRENDAQPRDLEVDRVVAEIYAERARREAIEHNRRGDYRSSRQVLHASAERIRQYAGKDAKMLEVIARLEGIEREFGERMDAMSMKRHHYTSESALKSRSFEGKALRVRRPGADGEVFTLETDTGHPIADINGVRCLLDTGSPVSIGRESFRILGAEHRPEAGLGPVSVEEISRLVGARVDVLVGTDVLAGLTWVLDWDAGRVRFSGGAALPVGRSVEATLRHGVPAIEIDTTDRRRQDRSGGGPRLAFLDTGARLSYMDPADVNGARRMGEEEDFFPVIGSFRVPVYKRTITVAGEAFRGTFGTLPAALGAILKIAGVNWILGSEVFRKREVLFDLQGGMVVFGKRRGR